MSAMLILQDLQARGFALALVGQGIKVTPASALTADDVAAIKAHKFELRAHLRRTQYYVSPADPLVVTRVPGDRFVDDLVQAGQLRGRSQDGSSYVPRYRLPGPASNPPIRKDTTPPLAALAGIPIEDLTPPEHWELIGGSAVVRPLSTSAEFRLWAAVRLYQRDGPGGPWQREYETFWRTFTTGEMA